MKNRVNRTILTPALNRGPATTPNPQPVQQAYYNARLLHTSPAPEGAATDVPRTPPRYAHLQFVHPQTNDVRNWGISPGRDPLMLSSLVTTPVHTYVNSDSDEPTGGEVVSPMVMLPASMQPVPMEKLDPDAKKVKGRFKLNC